MNINEIDRLLEETLQDFNKYIYSNLNIEKISQQKYFVEHSTKISSVINNFIKMNYIKK